MNRPNKEIQFLKQKLEEFSDYENDEWNMYNILKGMKEDYEERFGKW